jgi:hypothetical protein
VSDDCRKCRLKGKVTPRSSVVCAKTGNKIPWRNIHDFCSDFEAAIELADPDRPVVEPTKDTNPKDAIGATKLPMSLVPETAIALASLAHLAGALSYGKWNWRKAGVRASIYLDALKRHIAKWENGQELDSDSGLPHLAHALACLNIIVDSRACGKLTDDRPPSIDMDAFIAGLTPHVASLKAKAAGKDPRHYTIADSEAA